MLISVRSGKQAFLQPPFSNRHQNCKQNCKSVLTPSQLVGKLAFPLQDRKGHGLRTRVKRRTLYLVHLDFPSGYRGLLEWHEYRESTFKLLPYMLHFLYVNALLCNTMPLSIIDLSFILLSGLKCQPVSILFKVVIFIWFLCRFL